MSSNYANESPLLSTTERKSKYRDLLDQVEILQEREETGLKTTEVLDEILQNANFLFKDSKIENTKHTDEVLLDAKVVATASDVLLNVTEAIDCTLDFYEHIEFGRKINSLLLHSNEEAETNYIKLINVAKTTLQCIPKFSFMFGELGDEQAKTKEIKAPKPRSQRKKLEQVAKKEPEKIVNIGKEEDSVDDTVKFLQWVLNKEYAENGEKELNYFNFVINPTSYSATIENMFHFSFLIRDGRAKIEKKTDECLTIVPMSAQEVKRARKAGEAYKQTIISIDMDEWQAIVTKFGIKTCILSKWKKKWDTRKQSAS